MPSHMQSSFLQSASLETSPSASGSVSTSKDHSILAADPGTSLDSTSSSTHKHKRKRTKPEKREQKAEQEVQREGEGGNPATEISSLNSVMHLTLSEASTGTTEAMKPSSRSKPNITLPGRTITVIAYFDQRTLAYEFMSPNKQESSQGPLFTPNWRPGSSADGHLIKTNRVLLKLHSQHGIDRLASALASNAAFQYIQHLLLHSTFTENINSPDLLSDILYNFPSLERVSMCIPPARSITGLMYKQVANMVEGEFAIYNPQDYLYKKSSTPERREMVGWLVEAVRRVFTGGQVKVDVVFLVEKGHKEITRGTEVESETGEATEGDREKITKVEEEISETRKAMEGDLEEILKTGRETSENGEETDGDWQEIMKVEEDKVRGFYRKGLRSNSFLSLRNTQCRGGGRVGRRLSWS